MVEGDNPCLVRRDGRRGEEEAALLGAAAAAAVLLLVLPSSSSLALPLTLMLPEELLLRGAGARGRRRARRIGTGAVWGKEVADGLTVDLDERDGDGPVRGRRFGGGEGGVDLFFWRGGERRRKEKGGGERERNFFFLGC